MASSTDAEKPSGARGLSTRSDATRSQQPADLTQSPRRGAGKAARARRKTRRRLVPPPLVTLAILTLLTPAYFFLGSIKLSPSKIVFLSVVPVLTVKLFRGVYGRVVAADVLIFAFVVWMTVAMLITHTPRVALEFAGSNSIALLGGYLTARASIRTKEDFFALTRLLAIVVIVSLPFAIYETITSRTTIPRWLAMIPGVLSHSDINHEPRMGLWRVQFVFPHPIQYGLFCTLVFSLVFVGLETTIDRVRRLVTSLVIAVCCFLSVSSGPVLALSCQIGLIAWTAATRRISAMRWKIFGVIGVIGYIVCEIASGRPAIYAIVARLSFNPQTAHSRLLLFDYGMAQIYRTPFFGIGYEGFPLPANMTGSVDNFWLYLALRFGVPTFLFLAGAYLISMIRIGGRNFRSDPDLLAVRRAWMFTQVSTCLVLATVAIWGEAYSLVLLMLGSGVWLETVKVRSKARLRAARPTERIPTSASLRQEGL